jgi:hypothetical protein
VRQIRKRLTYANVMSSIAVFLVIGGATAFAALGKNTVGSKQLKKNAVTTAKIKRNAVTTAKIRKNAVTTAKIRNGAVTTDKIADLAVTTGKIANDAVTGDQVNESSLGQVPDAAKLGGSTASSYQKTADLLFATVAPASAAAAIVRGRGATSVARIATGFYAVTFERDITGCSWLATYGQPNNAGVNALWATVRGLANANELGVVLRNEAGTQVDGNGFHVAVLCP